MKNNNESKTTNKAEAVIKAIEEERSSDLIFAVFETCSMGGYIFSLLQQYEKAGDESEKAIKDLANNVGYELDCFYEHIEKVKEAREEMFDEGRLSREELN
jgi:hypothetical protein